MITHWLAESGDGRKAIYRRDGDIYTLVRADADFWPKIIHAEPWPVLRIGREEGE